MLPGSYVTVSDCLAVGMLSAAQPASPADWPNDSAGNVAAAAAAAAAAASIPGRSFGLIRCTLHNAQAMQSCTELTHTRYACAVSDTQGNMVERPW